MKKAKYLIATLAIIISCFYCFPTFAEIEENPIVQEENLIETPSTTEEIPTTTLQTKPAEINNFITIQYLDQTIFSGTVLTSGTYFTDDNGNDYTSSSTTALAALANVSRIEGFPLKIKNGWGNYYVSNIGEHEALGFDGWIYSVNMSDPGYTAMNDYLLQDNDQLSVYYSLWPWKINASTTTAQIGDSVVFTAFQYASSTWNIAPSTSISVNNQIFTTNQNGTYSYLATATTTLKAFIYGTKSWPQNSPAIEILVNEATTTTTSTTNEGQGSGNNNLENIKKTDSQINDATQKIISFLKSNQDESGKILDGNISDWVIMSFASAGIAPDLKLINYAYDYNFSDSSDLNLCASYPRHLLALKSAGYQNNNERIQNLLNYIKNNCYQNNKYGQDGINDDVFGLIALIDGGININDPMITGIITNIKSDQTPNGAFTWAGYEGADITGAVINALKYAETQGAVIEHEIYSKAKNYLKNNQLNDGGWGYETSDILTTSWVMMGINALGENQNDWFKNEKNPWYILVDNLNEDGTYKSTYAPQTTDWFGEKHALPALNGKAWPITPINIINNPASGAPEITTTSTPTSTPILPATSTIILTTTTLEIPTTTILNTDLPTTTVELNLENQIKISTTTKSEIKIKPKNQNLITKTTNNNQDTQITSTTTANTTTSTPNNNLIAQKTMFISGFGIVIIGLYLGLKLIKNLL